MKRHRNHVLENMSVTALRAHLPETWVMHPFHSDYGIDVQIEIFEDDGSSTGLRVYGQLKATDNSENDDVLRLDRNHFEYWSAHSDPVLLLRFFAESGKLKWCWMHEIEWRMNPDASSVDASSHLERWNQEETPTAIEQLARLRRAALHQRLPLPTTISVRNNTAEGVTGSLKLADLIAKRLPAASFKVFGESELPCNFDVLLEKTSLRLGHLGLPGYVVNRDSDCETIADQAVLLIFLIACRYDRSSVARVLASECSATLFRAASSQFQKLLFAGLVDSLGIDQAIPLILRETAGKEDPEFWLNLHAVRLRASDRGQRALWHKHLKEWVDFPPYPEMAGSAAYNFANSLANAGFWHESLDYYRLAGQRDPGYLTRDYYWVELGAAQFETGQASDAATSYQLAFGKNPSPDIQWRLGDALFHCGRYEMAYEHISSAVANDETLGSHPRLVMMVCRDLASTWGIKEQEIGPVGDSTQEEMMELNAVTSADDLILMLRPFLEICALDPQLSFNAGHLAGISNQPQLALYRFLTCALLQCGDAEAWACAIAAAWKAEEVDLLVLLTESAYFYVGEELLDAVLKSFRSPAGLPKESEVEFQRQLIGLIRAMARSGDESVTIRVHTQQGKYGTAEFRLE